MVVIVSVEVELEPGVKVALVGLTATVRPVAVGDTAADSVTVPVNPKLLTVIVEVPELPARMETAVGLAVTVKSEVTVKVNAAVCVVVPLTPLTVTV